LGRAGCSLNVLRHDDQILTDHAIGWERAHIRWSGHSEISEARPVWIYEAVKKHLPEQSVDFQLTSQYLTSVEIQSNVQPIPDICMPIGSNRSIGRSYRSYRVVTNC